MPGHKIQSDLLGLTQVGYDPERHGYFYDRVTGNPVTGGDYAVSLGKTVFVKGATFGPKSDYLYASNPQSNRLRDAYGFDGTAIRMVFRGREEG